LIARGIPSLLVGILLFLAVRKYMNLSLPPITVEAQCTECPWTRVDSDRHRTIEAAMRHTRHHGHRTVITLDRIDS